MTKRALITGITGQDGSYLAEFLLSKGYEVHGMVRRSSGSNTQRIDHILQPDSHLESIPLTLYYGDLTTLEQITGLIYDIRPDEIYNLGAQSDVRASFDMPEYTAEVTGLGAVRILEAIRRSGVAARFYQASSSEMFGGAPPPQNENSPFLPHSPYACAKVYAYHMTCNYRDGYGLYASNGILFNHESPRRGPNFVTRKITRAIVNIMSKSQDLLYLGNLDACRDWGFTPEYVETMWLMLQQDSPDDFVIGTGESHSVRKFLECAFDYAGLDWEEYVRFDPRYVRPVEVNALLADSSKAREILGWSPKIGLEELVMIMIDADMSAAGLDPPGHGYEALRSAFGSQSFAYRTSVPVDNRGQAVGSE
ncbi:MAG: GDP-mannose 4,6-dehydratase [Dehalococcoidia bacterium]|nr:GDP-mannose 4,6-dehydratase [Dehalococcoidia bacterium]